MPVLHGDCGIGLKWIFSLSEAWYALSIAVKDGKLTGEIKGILFPGRTKSKRFSS